MLKIGYKNILATAVFALFASLPSLAAPAAPVPVLVELFTSEGCSDCPSADSYLRTLDSTQPVSGAQLIVLEEHVDYWDDLGWRDPFSSHAFTQRQEDYVGRLHLASAYTPQMVVDGNYQFVGSDRRSAAKAFDSTRAAEKVAVRISAINHDGGNLRFHVESDAVPSNAEVVVALATERAESQVQRGENGGRHLEHVAIVRNLTTAGKAEKGQAFSKDITLTAKSLPLPGRLVVFLQGTSQGKVLGAAMEKISN